MYIFNINPSDIFLIPWFDLLKKKILNIVIVVLLNIFV